MSIPLVDRREEYSDGDDRVVHYAFQRRSYPNADDPVRDVYHVSLVGFADTLNTDYTMIDHDVKRREFDADEETLGILRSLPRHVQQVMGFEYGIGEPLVQADIRAVMEHYGESLGDLGATYCEDFLAWFREQEPDHYAAWKESAYPDSKPSGDDFLFDFSNNSLGGRLVQATHDTFLLSFANNHADAYMHIRGLIAGIDREE